MTAYPDLDATCILDDRIEFDGVSLRIRVMDGGRAAIVTALPDAASLFQSARRYAHGFLINYNVKFVLIESGLKDSRNIDYAMSTQMERFAAMGAATSLISFQPEQKRSSVPRP